jgi:ATP-binding cassette subfamily B protein
MRGQARPKNIKKTVLRILRYLNPYRLHLAVILLLVLISAGAQIASNYFLRPLINDYILPLAGQTDPDLSPLAGMLMVMGGIYLVGVVSTYTFNRLMVNVSSGALFSIRKNLFDHMQSLPIGYFDRHTHGELMSRFTNDTDALRDMLSQSLVHLLSSVITVIGVFVVMIILSPLLTCLVVLVMPLIFFSVKILGKKSGEYFSLQQKALGRVNSAVEELVSGQKVVKVFCREAQAKAQFAYANEELFNAARRAHIFASMLMPIMINLSHLLYAVTAMGGAVLTVTGYMDIGGLASFLQYTRSFSHPITHMSQQFNSVMHALAGAERIFAVLDETPEIDEGGICLVNVSSGNGESLHESKGRTGRWAWKADSDDSLVPMRGDIRMENVDFAYEKGQPVLQDINLFAKPGQKIAFVGSTGAGKTTLTNLINRFYEIEKGHITYDGIDIRAFRKADLRRSLGVVLQDTHLFTGTVRENIRYGRLEATDTQVEEAAKLANADTFIRHLPNGYDTLLTADGQNLSQGQRQLLSIARAAVADPPVLVLDEATSSVDTRTEALIEKGMDRLMKDRTVFVIAHRLSTVRNAHAILVIEGGRIIERGSHEDLIEQKGRYYALCTGRFELK